MTKQVANLVDSFYQLYVSTDGNTFKKVEHLQKCGMPSEEKVLDEVTATDDRRKIMAPVDFREDGELEFEYVLDPRDATHTALQKAANEGSELTFQIKFVKAASESRQFKGIVSKLTTEAEDSKKKIRKMGTIVITSDVSADVTEISDAV